jgi:hypothetical protein
VAFDWVDFKDNADFKVASFRKVATFWNSIFNKNADFMWSAFNFGAEFSTSKFDESADFSSSIFGNDAKFWWSRFNDTIDFDGAVFKTGLSFNYAKFNRDLMMNRTNFYSLDLTGTQFDKISKLYLLNSEYVRSDSNRIFVRWDSIRNNLAYDEIVYL